MNNESLNTFSQHPELENVRQLTREYAFTLKDIPELIRLRVYQSLGDARFEIEQSHYLQTPDMPVPAFCEAGPFASEDEAIAELLETFTSPYRDAVGRGLKPHQDWLLPNRDFH